MEYLERVNINGMIYRIIKREIMKINILRNMRGDMMKNIWRIKRRDMMKNIWMMWINILVYIKMMILVNKITKITLNSKLIIFQIVILNLWVSDILIIIRRTIKKIQIVMVIDLAKYIKITVVCIY